MSQTSLFIDHQPITTGTPIGQGFSIEIMSDKSISIYRYSLFYKNIKIKNAIDKRKLVVELVLENGVIKSKLASVLGISRQTIDNWINTYKKSGFEGLVHSYKGGVAKGRKEQADQLPTGNKARQLEQDRKVQREELEKLQPELNLKLEENGNEVESPNIFNDIHEFQESRYAGGFLYWGVFQYYYGAMNLCESHLGKLAWPIYLFAMMMIHGIKSVEGLKTVYKREFGIITGVKQLFSKPQLWEKIHALCSKGVSGLLIESFFKRQARLGLVSLCWLYLDGHFIPYYGKKRTHKGFYTQRDQMMQGQTSMYVHDGNGRIVYFEIQEGKGDLKQIMLKMSSHWLPYTGNEPPLIIADRETWGVKHFLQMQGYRFVTWEKHTDPTELSKLDSESFGVIFIVNDKEYQTLEQEKTYKDNEGNSITLRRIVIWNKSSNRRVACVTSDSQDDAITIASAMLGRWGASENGFKHLKDRLNMHYNPVIEISEDSENQKIANPEYVDLKKKIAELKKKISKCEKSLGRLPLTTNKDGTLRNSKRRGDLQKVKNELLVELEEAKNALSNCPERITLQDSSEKKFKKIEVEGKNMWDLAQTLVWNSRKKLIELFSEYLPNKRDLIPALDAFTKCNGWIKSSAVCIHIRLEPLETPRFHAAQVQLCRALNEKKIRLSNGKLLVYDVGSAPCSMSKKK